MVPVLLEGQRYVLTYRFSQDHLELLFNSIRASGKGSYLPAATLSDSKCLYSFQFVCPYVCLFFWKNAVLKTYTVSGSVTETILSIKKNVCVFVYPFAEFVTTVIQSELYDNVIQLNLCGKRSFRLVLICHFFFKSIKIY